MAKMNTNGNGFNNNGNGFNPQGSGWMGASTAQPFTTVDADGLAGNTGGTGYDWGFGNNGGFNNPQTDIFGCGTGTTTNINPDDNDEVTSDMITKIIKEAMNLYNNGTKDKLSVAKVVDKLRSKIKLKTFDPQNSPELKDIFGYMLGDVFSRFSAIKGAEYEVIISTLLELFPAGTTPVKSKYEIDAGKKSLISFAKSLRQYERANGISKSASAIKMMKIVEVYSSTKPGIKIPDDITALFEVYKDLN